MAPVTPSMAKLVAATASARDPLVFTRHIQSVSDCTSRKGGVPPSASSSICCRFRPNPSPIHSRCWSWRRAGQHLLPVQAEPLAHPQPMLGVRLFDADVLDQKGAGEVVFHLDQGFRQKLREIVDERVDLQDPALHLLDTEARRGYRFRPWTVDQAVPMGSHEFVHGSDPPRVRGYLVYRIGVHVHGLLSQVVELRTVAGTAQWAESVPVRAIPADTCARNGPGGESQWPCAKSTPISRSADRPISPSTASPIVFLPITCPTSLMARTIA